MKRIKKITLTTTHRRVIRIDIPAKPEAKPAQDAPRDGQASKQGPAPGK